MSIQTEAIKAVMHSIKLSMHTFAPAKVLSFDEAKQEANIELLFMQVNGSGKTTKYPMIMGVPVLGMRYKVEEYAATVTGLTDPDGAVDGSAAKIKPKTEMVYKPFLKKDDIVFVAFAERALDNLQKQPFNPEYSRMFNIQDAVIIGTWGL